MTHLLGLDLGTSSIKVLLVTEAGQMVGSGSAEYPIHHPGPDQAEQDPEDWWQATVSAVGRALSGASSDPVSVAAIGLSGQIHGTVLLDHKGQLLTAAIGVATAAVAFSLREVIASVGGWGTGSSWAASSGTSLTSASCAQPCSSLASG